MDIADPFFLVDDVNNDYPISDDVQGVASQTNLLDLNAAIGIVWAQVCGSSGISLEIIRSKCKLGQEQQ